MTDEAIKKRANGEGSVFYRKSDDRWCASLTVVRPDGTTHRPTKTAKTEHGARIKLKEMKRAVAKDGDIYTSRLTVAAWMMKWFETDVVKELRPKTAASYKTNITQYIIPAIGTRLLAILTPDDVRKVATYVEAKGLSSRTSASAYQTLSLGLEAARKEGKAPRNTADLVKRPRTKKAKLALLTADDAIKILYTVAGDRLGSRWAAALLTGARQGELLGLELDRVGDSLDLSWQLQRITWEHGCEGACDKKQGAACPKRKITIPEDHEVRHLEGGLWLSRPKSSKSWRIIPLVEPLRTIIERRVEVARNEPNPHGLLWTSEPDRIAGGGYKDLDGRPLDPSRDNKAWHAVLDRAGLHDARLHDARHTAVDLLYDAGVPEVLIQDIVGQSVLSVTRGYKSKGNHAQLSAALTSMSALVNPLSD
ncbi:hypothetical protein ASC66_01045 [Leifsonia sp. Root4]|uniref:site-specific integrase n=1 Tax=Leifsonia sp. Root4 TaxID=1736525 RepID=UPI0006FAC38A|nr:tyrosine-type recombinase/integrase [Leifsonia sp. Root4]KQW07615.1 hypothetical protein ASC66_01045 [Leifsonia sp. Root4]